MAAKEVHVLIIGAGITGLLIAQALKKSNIPFTLFESEPSASYYRTGDWGMTIHWSKPLLEKLLPQDLWDRIREFQVDPSFDDKAASDYVIPFYNAKTGEHLKSAPTPNAMRASRRKMRRFCRQGIEVSYGKDLASVKFDDAEGRVTAIFEDGESASGSLLVGSDGHRSKVRELLFGKEKAALSVTGSGFNLTNVTVCYNDAAKATHVRQLHPINWCGFHPEKNICIWSALVNVPDPAKPEDWVFQYFISGPGLETPGMTRTEKLAAQKQMTVDMAEPWKSAYEWIPEDAAIWSSQLKHWETTQWDNHHGTITLAGDAAHSMPPHRGQGLNHSIQDAVNIMEAIAKIQQGKSTPSESINEYDAELVKRGADEVKTSVMSAILTHDFEKLMQAPVMKQGYTKSELK